MKKWNNIQNVQILPIPEGTWEDFKAVPSVQKSIEGTVLRKDKQMGHKCQNNSRQKASP